ncbi:hypothetical protein [Bradyrhizobium sp. 33ap4]|uniref:glycoside hydrolase family 19 protein n=1 Tax=Bradyrhizobium sp. 33ap4 TaxID=3061630 RepID=UPI00292DCC96|nr:hypothetical protein [Bradyrhizobium sp. 33ap4]
MLTAEIMHRMWPRASAAVVDAIVRTHEQVFARYEINTPLRVAHFMAQISWESGRGTISRENMNYRAERIVEVFGFDKAKGKWHHSAKVTDAEAQQLAHRPEALAERVYGLGNPKKAKELGNTRPGDAYRCRGGGFLQLTGAGSYKRIGEMTGFPLYEHPELLDGPETSLRVAAAEFKALNCLPAADADNVALVTRRVNGPNSNGTAERAVLLRQWKQVLPGIEAPLPRPRAAEDPAGKTLVTSNIVKGAGGVIGSLATAGGAEVAKNANTDTTVTTINNVADKLQHASDVAQTISVAKDNATVIVNTVKPFLGLAPSTWQTIAVIAVTAAVCCAVFVIFERWRKMRDQGV